ncbi:UNVERIFIED_ORG: hypothetical protein J2X79_002002 [Arthrobacter globiformis]|nr:hypothetical protein [Arthrobacter globiformis]
MSDSYYHGEDEFPFDPDDPDDKRRTIAAFIHMAKAADNLLSDVPSDMKGEYIDDQRKAWEGDTEQNWAGLRESVDAIAKDLQAGLMDVGDTALRGAGFVGQAGKAKFRQLRDAIAEFLKLRSGPRASKMLHACVYVLASMVNLLPGVPGMEAIKEAFEGFKYVADLALKGD